MAIKNIMKRSGLFMDAVPPEEEEITHFMSPTAHSNMPPPFVLNDISSALQASRPSINLLFDGDVFDFKPEIVTEPTRYMSRGREKSFAKQTPIADSINIPKENGAVSSSSVADRSHASPPEDEDPDKK